MSNTPMDSKIAGQSHTNFVPEISNIVFVKKVYVNRHFVGMSESQQGHVDEWSDYVIVKSYNRHLYSIPTLHCWNSFL